MAYKFILPMNEGQGMVLYDKSGIGNHGLNYGDWAYTRYGKAVYLPSDSNFVTVPHNPTLNITSEVTLEGLLKIGEESLGDEFPAGPAGWSWKRAITISPATPVDNYQIKVVLTTSNFDYTHANVDGSDLRFYTTNDVKLPYWIESWDPNGTSTIWVKVTSSNTDTIYMYYGNPSASSESDGDAVFDFFDDFDSGEVETVDYFASNGIGRATHGIIAPCGTYYNNKTFIVWQGTNLDPYAIEYNHTTGEWSNPVQVGDNPLSSDDHGAPAILRDADGYLHVFYGCHGTETCSGDACYIQHAKSNSPDDISAWTDKGNICAQGATYPNPVLISSDIYIFYRKCLSGGWCKEVYSKSTDNGETWGSENDIIDFGSGYTIYHGRIEAEGTSKIHVSWVVYDYSDSKRKNVYHAYLNLSDLHMYAMDGTDLGTTIDKTAADNHCLVLDSGTAETNLAKVHLDSSGTPYIIFLHDDSGWKVKFTKWNGSSWDTPTIITSTDNQFNSHDFIVHSSSNIELYLTAGGSAEQGGDIEKWSWNGSTWIKDSTVLSESTYGKPLNCPVIVQNYNSNLKVIFSEYTGDYTTSLKVFAFGDSGIVQAKELRLDTSKWTVDTTVTSYSVANSKLTIDGCADSQWQVLKGIYTSSFPLQSGFAVEVKDFTWSEAEVSNTAIVGITLTDGTSWNAPIAEHFTDVWSGSSGQKKAYVEENSYGSGSGTLALSGTAQFKITKLSDNNAQVYWDDTSILGPYTSTTTISKLYILVNKYSTNAFGTFTIDRIVVRKYTSPEPSTTVGTEEEAGGGEPPVNLGALELKKGSAYGMGINGSQALAMINNNVITGDISPQVWNHVIMTYDGSSQKLYVNGQLRNSQSLSGAINTNTNSFEISTSGGPAYCAFARLNDNAFNESEVKARFAEVRDYTRMLYNCYGCDDGLALYLPMHEGQGSVAGDQSGKGNDGTIYNANWTNVDGAYRLYFNGSNAYVDCGNDKSLDITDEITLETWAKLYPVTGFWGRVIVGKGDDYKSPYGLWVGKDLTGGHFQLVNNSDEDFGVGNYTFTAGVWYHIVGTYDGTSVKYYINSELEASRDVTDTIKITTEHLRISFAPNRAVNGIIDLVRIYNRALSEREISYHYQNQLPNHQ